ncbi:MAG: bifunctional ADP-heptose synthase [Bacteroidota bacterium]
MNLDAIFESFNNKRVLVIGDVMIDAYILGKVSRISPEAPVPIINFDKKEDRLGGAANVALNLVSLGASPIICSVIGNDSNAEVMKNLLAENHISSDGLVVSPERKTTVKTRVIGNNQHLLRIDDEQVNSISRDEENLLIAKVEKLISSGVDGIIFEDYNKGVLTQRVIETIINLANEQAVVTVVDPKKENFFAYKNVTLFKPNLKELKEGMNTQFSFPKEINLFEDSVSALEAKLNNKISFITLSEHGVFIKDQSDKYFVPAHLRNIADVSGAGDTVISVAALCLIAGCSIHQLAQIANIAGGLVCEKSGVVAIDKNELQIEAELLVK